MATNIEIEVKVLLSKADFRKVEVAMNADQYDKVSQTNYYIDTGVDGQLRRYGISLRVRELDKQLELNLKTPLAEAILEKTQDLTSVQFKKMQKENVFPRGHIYEFVESLGIDMDKLQILASLETIRTSFNYKGYKFSLDTNYYDNIKDYELEMQGSSLGKAEDLLREICELADVPFVINNRSKQARAIAQSA